MKRLTKENLNTDKEYNRIFFERQKKGVDWFDLKRWKALIKYAPKKGVLFDLGCLDSLVIPLAKKKSQELWCIGIDVAEQAIYSMNTGYGWAGQYRVEDIYSIQCSSGIVNYAVMGEVLEHLEYPEKAIKEAMRVLKKGSILALSTPLEETEAGEFDKDRHIWSFSKEDIKNLLSPYGKVKIETLGSNLFPHKYHPKVIIAFCKKQ